MSHRTALQVGVGLALLLGVTLGGSNATAAEPSTAVVAKYDKDSDKTLDWNEVQTAASARFDRLNQDSDGTLDAQALTGIIGPARFKAADPDNDGTLSRTEYLDPVKKMFAQADAHSDGTLDAKELGSKAGRRLKPLSGYGLRATTSE